MSEDNKHKNNSGNEKSRPEGNKSDPGSVGRIGDYENNKIKENQRQEQERQNNEAERGRTVDERPTDDSK